MATLRVTPLPLQTWRSELHKRLIELGEHSFGLGLRLLLAESKPQRPVSMDQARESTRNLLLQSGCT